MSTMNRRTKQEGLLLADLSYGIEGIKIPVVNTVDDSKDIPQFEYLANNITVSQKDSYELCSMEFDCLKTCSCVP